MRFKQWAVDESTRNDRLPLTAYLCVCIYMSMYLCCGCNRAWQERRFCSTSSLGPSSFRFAMDHMYRCGHIHSPTVLVMVVEVMSFVYVPCYRYLVSPSIASSSHQIHAEIATCVLRYPPPLILPAMVTRGNPLVHW